MADLDFHGFAKDMIHHGYASVVILTLILYEYLSTLEDEVQYIWLSPWSKTKCTYLFARYFALVYATTVVIFSLVWPPPLPVPPSKCMGWYLHGMSCFSAQYIASHVTLSRRIMASYEVRNVGSALLVLHVSELAGALFSGKKLSTAKFNGVCDVLDVPHAVFVFDGIFFLGQLLMWVLILRGSRRRGTPTSSRPAVREMIYHMWYDGEAKIAWVLCSLVFVISTYRTITGQTVKPVYLFAWPICLLSVGTCRYILSMERNTSAHARTSQCESHEMGPEVHANDDNNNSGHHGCGSPLPIRTPPASLASRMSSKPYVAPLSYSDSFETLSSESQRWRHPSCLQEVLDSTVIIAKSSSDISSDLVRRTSTTSTNSYISTLRPPSISTCATEETEITAPSIGARSSLDIEIGSLHSSSSVTSEEVREFWNEVWREEERAFPHA